WFLYARFGAKAPWNPVWGGPSWVAGNDLSDAGPLEVIVRTSIGGVLFFAFIWLCWRWFLKGWWERGEDPPAVARGRGWRAAFGADDDPLPGALPGPAADPVP
ncbi:MAG: hypothetical protein KDB04_16430, partial [Acidimicrobiales bacterium]|nr:hypothetical protein [Acidimicrobiales bacterium]